MALLSRALAGVFIVEAAATVLAATLIVDLRAHTSEEQLRGVNQWGYRGPARRMPIGVRVAVLGGAAAYGYGVDWAASFPSYLESLINRDPRRDPTRHKCCPRGCRRRQAPPIASPTSDPARPGD